MRTSNYSNAPIGDHILRPDKAGTWYLRRPNKEGHMMFRVFPHVVDGSIVPQFIDLDKQFDDTRRHVSDAFCLAETVTFWGTKKFSMITEAPATGEFSGFSQSPAMLFYRAIMDHKDNNPRMCPQEWHDWCKRVGYGAPLQRPQESLYMKGAIFAEKGKATTDRNSGKPSAIFPAVVMVYQRTGVKDFMNKLTQPLDSLQPLSTANCELGDITDPDNGNLVVITPNLRNNPQTGREQTYYDVSKGEPFVVDKQDAIRYSVDWEEVLNFQPLPTLIQHIAETFSPEAVNFALGDSVYREYIPASIKRLGAPAEGTSVNIGLATAGSPAVAPAAPAADAMSQVMSAAMVASKEPVSTPPVVKTANASLPPIKPLPMEAPKDDLMQDGEEIPMTFPGQGQDSAMQSAGAAAPSQEELMAALNSAQKNIG
jgi:hypothetical protein